jgi:hypothetical protein
LTSSQSNVECAGCVGLMLVNASICWKRRVLDVSYLINVIVRLNVGNELVAY